MSNHSSVSWIFTFEPNQLRELLHELQTDWTLTLLQKRRMRYNVWKVSLHKLGQHRSYVDLGFQSVKKRHVRTCKILTNDAGWMRTHSLMNQLCSSISMLEESDLVYSRAMTGLWLCQGLYVKTTSCHPPAAYASQIEGHAHVVSVKIRKSG